MEELKPLEKSSGRTCKNDSRRERNYGARDRKVMKVIAKTIAEAVKGASAPTACAGGDIDTVEKLKKLYELQCDRYQTQSL